MMTGMNGRHDVDALFAEENAAALLVENATADCEKLCRVLDRETELVVAGDWSGVELLVDEKRWYADRLHNHLAAVRHRRDELASLGGEALAPLIEGQRVLAASSQRNALLLAQARDLNQRIVDVIVEVARSKGSPVSVYGSNARRRDGSYGRAAPVNINGSF
jgi:hypothetical protein